MTEDEGAVAVVIAITMVMLLGFAAFAVDAGAIYQERRELQNGADAAVLALAGECAEGLVDCGSASIAVLGGVAQPYADSNANDGRSGVPEVVPHGTDPSTCELESDTAPNPLTGANVVKVTTRTIDASNENSFLSHFLAPIIGVDSSTVYACAVAAWGYARSLSTFPLTISTCEFNLAPETGTPTVLYPGPHPNSLAVQETITFHSGTGGDEDPCNAQAGHDTDGDGSLPAGFGWLNTNANCEIVTTTVDGQQWVDKDSGNNPECSDTELAALLNTVVQIPVFNDFCRPPHNPAPGCPNYNNSDKYRIATYASFYLQGYRLGGPAYRGGNYSSCPPSDRCIVGYFTTSTAYEGEIGGPVGGVIVVQLQG